MLLNAKARRSEAGGIDASARRPPTTEIGNAYRVACLCCTVARHLGLSSLIILPSLQSAPPLDDPHKRALSAAHAPSPFASRCFGTFPFAFIPGSITALHIVES